MLRDLNSLIMLSNFITAVAQIMQFVNLIELAQIYLRKSNTLFFFFKNAIFFFKYFS